MTCKNWWIYNWTTVCIDYGMSTVAMICLYNNTYTCKNITSMCMIYNSNKQKHKLLIAYSMKYEMQKKTQKENISTIMFLLSLYVSYCSYKPTFSHHLKTANTKHIHIETADPSWYVTTDNNVSEQEVNKRRHLTCLIGFAFETSSSKQANKGPCCLTPNN